MKETGQEAGGVRRAGFRSIAARLMVWILGCCGLVYLCAVLYSDALSRRMMVRSAEKVTEGDASS